MFRLTREVRFAVNPRALQPTDQPVTNGYAGYPSLSGFGQFFALRLTVSGELSPASQYLVNIKHIDAVARRRGIEFVHASVLDRTPPPLMVARLHERLGPDFDGVMLEKMELSLSPFLTLAALTKERPMVRLSQKFEFSASHRLFNRELSDEENRRTFGKCSNPHGHGHNYELQVTLAGEPDAVGGVLKNLPDFERIVSSAVIERFDHKNLNVDVPEFVGVIPSVENIARVIYRILRPQFADAGAKLAAVTVWETPKTWCEYSE